MKLYGKNCVTERINKNPQSIKKVFVEANGVETQNFASLQKRHIHVERLSKHEFNKKSQGIPCQGIIAEVEDFKYAYLEDVLNVGAGFKPAPTILFLDNWNDPQNLGSILRTAACFGGFAVVLPKHDSVEVTEAVLRVAQGAENYCPVCKVANLSIAIDKAKNKGYWIAGAVVEAGENLSNAALNFPLGIVIGSEGKGIRQGLLGHLDGKFSLPMKGAKLSFNAAVAAALFCYEATRQRQK